MFFLPYSFRIVLVSVLLGWYFAFSVEPNIVTNEMNRPAVVSVVFNKALVC